MTAAVFELGGALAAALPELAIGPWTRTPPGLASFDAGAGPPESLWRVDLARDAAASRAALAGGERSVAQTHAALDDVPRRLDRALAALAGAGPNQPLPPDVPQAWPAGSPGEPRSSAQAPGRLAQALHGVADLARGRARIETQIEGALVACSVTTLSGDTELWIAPRLSPAVGALHARSVAVALQTRHAWTRILALVVAGCGRLAAFGLPAAGVAAVSLIWRFLGDVLREVHALATPRS